MSTEYKGIDISLFQGKPDFAAVRAAGIDFVMIKASQGRMDGWNRPFADPEWDRSMGAAGAAGLLRGAYHYFCASTEEETREEAAFFIGQLGRHRFGVQLWAAVDVEDGTFIRSDYAGTSANVRLFCELVKEAGYLPMVYANTWWLDSKFSAPAGVPIWEANLGIAARPARARIWQHSFTGRVNGIAGDVDLDAGVDIIGDANGDGKVNNRDVSGMLKRGARWAGVTLNESQADLNMDGKVDNADIAELKKRLAGWRP